MTRRALAAVGLGAWLALPGGAAPPAEVTGTPVDVVFFAPTGPALIRLQIAIDGRPTEAVWRAAADKLFSLLDRNADGTLDAKEVEAANQAVRAMGLGDDPGPRGRGALRFAERDGKVNPDAFAAGLRSAGGGSVRVVAQVGRADTTRSTEALMARLDADGDGKLSADELAAARDRLAAIDANEDELITAAELTSTPEPTPVVMARQPRTRRPTAEANADWSAADLLELRGTERAVPQLLAARDADKSGGLSRQEIGATAAAFAELDKDGNGQLDADELEACLRKPPAIEAFLALGEGETTTLIRPERRSLTAAAPVRVSGADFRFSPATGELRRVRDSAGQTATLLRQQLEQLIGDKPGIDRRQFQASFGVGGAVPPFELLDRDADGTVTKAELKGIAEVWQATAACRAEVTIVDGGRGLFEWIDRNGDGRLSPRELLTLRREGPLTPTDIPRQFAVRVSPVSLFGPTDVPARVADLVAMSAAPVRPPPRGSVPAWFSDMDRNADGDVSLHEFLGPLAAFHKLDRDGDGLISPEEAGGK